MDLHERRELDMSAQVARVKARARPWKAIIALVLALIGLAAGEFGRFSRRLDPPIPTALRYSGAAVFLAFGLIAAFGLSGQARDLLRPVIGAAHAGVARYALVLASIFTVLVITLNIADLPVGQLVLGGAVTGVLLGIAAQQSLANLFAGMVLLFARPFHVGDRVRFRAGALYGLLDGTVTDISITYVRLETAEGLIFIPNSQALAACVGPLPPPEPDPEPPAAAELAARGTAVSDTAVSDTAVSDTAVSDPVVRDPVVRDTAANRSALSSNGAISSASTMSSASPAAGDGSVHRDGAAARD